MSHRLIIPVFLLAFTLQAQEKKQPPKPPVPPDFANVSYGPHERNVFDLWKAKSDHPTPILIHIHGGAFRAGDKGSISAPLLQGCLKAGISVASINYRYATIAPYPAPMADSARAVQFIRLHANEYNINPKAVSCTGGSAGAGISLWIGFRDEMADPKNADPVLRQSTRLTSIATSNGQSTYDPNVIATLIDPETAKTGALTTLIFGMKGGGDITTEKARRLFYDASSVNYLSAGDPPVFMYYTRGNTPLPAKSQPEGIHHPKFGYFLKEKMDKLGIPCEVHTADDYSGPMDAKVNEELIAFLLKYFPKH